MKVKGGFEAYNSVWNEFTCESQLTLHIERSIHGDVNPSVNLREKSATHRPLENLPVNSMLPQVARTNNRQSFDEGPQAFQGGSRHMIVPNRRQFSRPFKNSRWGVRAPDCDKTSAHSKPL